MLPCGAPALGMQDDRCPSSAHMVHSSNRVTPAHWSGHKETRHKHACCQVIQLWEDMQRMASRGAHVQLRLKDALAAALGQLVLDLPQARDDIAGLVAQEAGGVAVLVSVLLARACCRSSKGNKPSA